MKNNSFSKNYLFNLVYNLAVGIAPLVTTPYLSRVLGPEQIGKFSFAQSIVTYFALVAALGTAQYGQRKIAGLNEDEVTQRKAFWEIVNIRFLLTAITLLVYYVIVLPNCGFFALYLSVSLDILFVGMDISWYFWGKNDFSLVSFTGCLSKLAYIAAVFLFVRNEQDIVIYAVLFSGTNVMACVMQWLALSKTSLLHSWKPRCNLKRHLMPSFSLFSVQAATTIYTVLDKTMIGLITGSDAQNGYYEQAQKLVRMVIILITSVSPVVATSVAAFWKKNDTGGIQKILEQSFCLVMGLSVPCCFGLFLIADRFVPIYYGEAFLEVVPLIHVLSFLIPAVGCSSVLGVQYFIPSKQENHYRHAVVFSAVINVVFNAVLIFRFGAKGASLASVLAEWAGAIWMFCVIKNQINLVPIIKQGVRYLLFSGIMTCVGMVVSFRMSINFFSMIFVILICVLIYGSLLFLCQDQLLQMLIFKDKDVER